MVKGGINIAEFCNEECERHGAVCDFCKLYDFNGDENGAYTGNGYCNRFLEYREPYDGIKCDEFICFNVV